jgi:molecular chaperone GrpE (heat shock protein)
LSESAMCRFLQKQKLTVKKNLRSSQADKKKYKKAADRILEKIRNFAPENFVNFLY